MNFYTMPHYVVQPPNFTNPKTRQAVQRICKATFACLLTVATFLTGEPINAQTIQFTSTPVTTGVENVNYNYSLSGIISNNDKLDFTAVTIPSWLTLGSGGAASGTQVNTTTMNPVGGVAGDENGNFYAVSNGATTIYKITPDGTTTAFATRSTSIGTNNYGAIVVGKYLYVSGYNYPAGGIERFDITETNPTGTIIYTGTAILSMTAKDGFLYGACYATGKILRIDLSDNSTSYYVEGLATTNPFGLGFTASGDLLVAYWGAQSLVKYSNGTISTVLTGLPGNATDVKVDAGGNVYISFSNAKIRKYTPDFSSFIEVSGTTTRCWGMTLTASGTLIYGDNLSGNLFTLQTGATLSGTPSHKDVGQHNVTIRVSNGTVSADQEFVITVTDPNPPVVNVYSPAALATGVALDGTLNLSFSETVVKGEGNLYIKSAATDEILQTIDIAGSSVSIDDNVLSVAVSGLPALTAIYVTADAGILKDVNGNDYAGINSASVWAFQTMEQPKSEQVITFVADSAVVYGVADFVPSANTSSALAITYTSGDEGIATVIDGKLHIKAAGTVAITASQDGDDDYLAAVPLIQQLTITKKDITVSLNAQPAITKVYDGNTDIALAKTNYTLNGIINDDDVRVTGTAVYATASAAVSNTVTVNNFVLKGENTGNYNLTTAAGTVAGVITPKEISVALNASPAITKVYNANTTASLQAENYSLSGVLEGDEVNVAGTAAYADKNTGADKDITVNSFVLGGTEKGNYTLLTASAVVKGAVTPAALTITAEDKTKKQGAVNPAFTFAYTGLAGNDSPSDLTTAAQAQSTALASSPIGYFTIAASGASSDNYSITFKNGKLTVTPAAGDHLKVWSSSVSVLQIRVYAETAQESSLTLFTATGQPVIVSPMPLQVGVSSSTMAVGSLAPGVYVLNIQAGNFKESVRVKIK
ncbi:MAG: YDG domain-containing protein [Chitinophagaceae bacterium]